MTLDRAFIRLEKVFSPGQAYVALSRCRTLEGLQIAVLKPEFIRADPKVVKLYDQIDRQPNHVAAAPQMSMDQGVAGQPRRRTAWRETLFLRSGNWNLSCSVIEMMES
ncbi:hypothetical protein BCR37DRAFT_116481 [Protomyces lactucae-debilis]|uniref:Uncharacterized protein n=1 Tax=Protomyces lactucae-debilis TaxID=2754530 RepID=A0A1Y2F2U2_PROLT|nr:uncharacterized protein BCR37DRAFT_116481 [Protomyces lactucae-debilis]ORY78210.1 hypothetical protein BCR37DRAFT_116481 [Protomyces lactucae-debilis]